MRLLRSFKPDKFDKITLILFASAAAIGISWAFNLQSVISPGRKFPPSNLKVSSPQPAAVAPPQQPQSSSALKFSHRNIVTTVFWAGEQAGPENGYIANNSSAWDENWVGSYGGVDSPDNRRGYMPAGFIPKENPFYAALPYNDIDENGRKPSASKCPQAPTKINYSWCKNSWLAISCAGKTAYAQWEDVGPFGEDDSNYVFGGDPPANKEGERAGLDVSPAVRDYLGLGGLARCDWTFVPFRDVPTGPWTQIITKSGGYTVE